MRLMGWGRSEYLPNKTKKRLKNTSYRVLESKSAKVHMLEYRRVRHFQNYKRRGFFGRHKTNKVVLKDGIHKTENLANEHLCSIIRTKKLIPELKQNGKSGIWITG